MTALVLLTLSAGFLTMCVLWRGRGRRITDLESKVGRLEDSLALAQDDSGRAMRSTWFWRDAYRDMAAVAVSLDVHDEARSN